METNHSENIPVNTNKIGQLSFNLGVFFLSTALPISGIFLIVSIFISFVETKFQLLNDKWNLIILFIGGLFIFNSLRFNFLDFNSLPEIERTVSTLDLFNWIPLFILFTSSQYYLRNESQRLIFSRYLISGTIPVLISCILQYRFKIYGPFKTLYGLIVIFNKDLGVDEGVSGLFSNPNYTGMWLSITLPILLLLIIQKKRLNLKKIILVLVLIFLIYSIFLTLSRNALASLLSTFLIIFGIKKILLLSFLIFFIYLSFGILDTFINLRDLNLIGEFQIQNLINKLSMNNISNFSEFTRIKIWLNTLKLIVQKPIFGFGASTFPIVFYNLTNLKMQHSHNMPLQLAYDYGLPISLLLTSFISFLFLKSLYNIFQTRNLNNQFLFNRCWLASCMVAILSHIYDITYYDGKISILIWIFIAGLKCINDECNFLKIKSNHTK